MIHPASFPRLHDTNFKVTSPASIHYNCVAWVAADIERWWQPGVYWPVSSPPGDFGLAVLQGLFASMGFEECSTDDFEPEFEKIAMYGNSLFYTHVAKQLRTGKWTSKLGKLEDIEHESPDDVAGGIYGEVVQLMRRRIPRG